MGQILHGSATTTYAIRAAIQRSKAPFKELAARSFLHDAPMGPKTPRSTVMSAEEEAVAVAFRKHTLLPLGDDPAPHPLSPAPLLPAAPHQPAARDPGR